MPERELTTELRHRQQQRRATTTILVVILMLFFAFWYAYSYYRDSTGVAAPTTSTQTCRPFDPKVAKTDAKIGARESATVGIKQIYSPMVDVSSEPRWGRIVEGNGEDPYLGSEMAVARVQGAQGDDYSARNKTVTSVKHFVGYGASQGGLNWAPAFLPPRELREVYLHPFEAVVRAGHGLPGGLAATMRLDDAIASALAQQAS